jgi:hypothetical protein
VSGMQRGGGKAGGGSHQHAAAARTFQKYDVVETSYHFYTDRIGTAPQPFDEFFTHNSGILQIPVHDHSQKSTGTTRYNLLLPYA